jgi:hypothetical protein
MHSSRIACLFLSFVACAPAGPDTEGVGSGSAGKGGGPNETDGNVSSPSGGAGNGADADTSSGASKLPPCAPAPACNGELPELGTRRSFTSPTSSILAKTGAHHRGRDTMVKAGERATLVARFTYGLDFALEGEEVDVFLDQGCAGSWKPIGTVKTTDEDEHPPVAGVVDDGGRVFVDLETKDLPLGRHRIALVVAGDGTKTDLVVDVVAPNVPVVVSDVDGTLTIFEQAEFLAAPANVIPPAQPGAAEVLTTFAKKGFRVAYVTARPEWLIGRTREFVAARGLPPGVVRTSPESGLGPSGDGTVAYKTNELALLAKQAPLAWVFGNTPTDAAAYETTGLPPERRIFIAYDGDTRGGRTVKSWTDLAKEVTALPAVCE